MTDEPMDEFEGFNREEWLERWDSWRKYIAEGGKGSWSRDAFESLLDHVEESLQASERATIERIVKKLRGMFEEIENPPIGAASYRYELCKRFPDRLEKEMKDV